MRHEAERLQISVTCWAMLMLSTCLARRPAVAAARGGAPGPRDRAAGTSNCQSTKRILCPNVLPGDQLWRQREAERLGREIERLQDEQDGAAAAPSGPSAASGAPAAAEPGAKRPSLAALQVTSRNEAQWCFGRPCAAAGGRVILGISDCHIGDAAGRAAESHVLNDS